MKDVRRVLEQPSVPALNDNNEIDLDQLGAEDLLTYIKYSGIQINDKVTPRWFGASPSGEAFDDVQSTYYVEAEDLNDGVPVEIANAIVVGAGGGEAFYSYTVNDTEDSLRKFCFVGIRPRAGREGISVVHAIQSHELVIKPNELETAGVNFVILPYQAMQIGDRITFTFQGVDEYGFEDPPEVETLVVTKEHFGEKPLGFTVGKNLFRFIDPGSAKVSYRITFVDGQTAQSPLQNFTVDSDEILPGYLPEPVIVGHVPGETLDPGKFREGLTVTIEGYPGLDISDQVVLRWRSPVRDLVQVMRVDASTLAVGAIIFRVPAEFVLENQGLGIGLSYLFSREGAGQRSQELPVTVATARVLTAPRVIDATPDEQNDHGTLRAIDGISGVRVQVPDVLQPGESLHVHWSGWPVLGEYIATTPQGSDPLTFHIPAQYVPANMGRGTVDQSRRFEVSYRVIVNGDYLESSPYHLRISPLPTNEYPRVSCEQAVSGSLSLARVPSAGADLVLGTWRFGGAGQLLNLSISGVTQSGALNEDIRDASEPVTANEASNGIRAKLPRALLQRLKLNEAFTLHARVSFDGGVYYVSFPNLSLTLLP